MQVRFGAKSNSVIRILTPEVTGTHVETKVYRLNFVIDREFCFCHSCVTIFWKNFSSERVNALPILAPYVVCTFLFNLLSNQGGYACTPSVSVFLGESSLYKTGLCVLLSLGLLCVSSGVCLAQSSTATITGIVKDASGSVIPAAEVLLTNTQTNVERKATTNDVGSYAFLNIIPGEYRLQANKTGFKTSKQAAFTLTVNQTVTFDLTLEIGEISQEVTVEAVGAELQSSTAELGAVVAKQQVVDLPLNGRNFTQLLSLTPGVAPVSVSQNSGGFGASATAGSAFVFPSVNGQNNRSNFFLLDGVNNQGALTSTYAVPPIIDAVQEFKVQSHNDQAEFGQALGGIINVVSKSGTNEYHGSAWEFLRNDALDARNPFLTSKTPFRQNQYGAAGGGPIIKNKTFFFAGWQGFKYRRTAEGLYRCANRSQSAGRLQRRSAADLQSIHDPAGPCQCRGNLSVIRSRATSFPQT